MTSTGKENTSSQRQIDRQRQTETERGIRHMGSNESNNQKRKRHFQLS